MGNRTRLPEMLARWRTRGEAEATRAEALAVVERWNAALDSRKAIDWTTRLPAIATGAAVLKAKSFTIDGEAVVIGPDGLTDFEALRRRGAGDIAVLYAFDLIELDGSDLRGMPIETRKATLASLLRKAGAVRLSEHIAADGPQVFAHACRLGAEGIVSKRLG